MPNLYSYPYPRLSDKRMRSGFCRSQARTGILNAAGWHEQVEDRQDSPQIRRRIELQANCFSGMAMKQSGKVSRSELIDWSDGRTNSNTHGSSEHYVAWTLQGHKYRNVHQCNTFRARAGDVSDRLGQPGLQRPVQSLEQRDHVPG